MNSGGHNLVHNIFLSDSLCCLITFTVYRILPPNPACQQLPTARDLYLRVTGIPRTWKGSWRHSHTCWEGCLCLRKFTGKASCPLFPSPSDLARAGKSQSLGPGTNSLFFYKEQSTKRKERLSWALRSSSGLRPWRRPQEALAAAPGINSIQDMAGQGSPV